MTKLNPCQHCGCDRAVYFHPAVRMTTAIEWRARCPACGACSGWRDTKEQAAEAWHARAVNLETTIDRVVKMRCALANKRELGGLSAGESAEFDFLTQSMRTLLNIVRVKAGNR